MSLPNALLQLAQQRHALRDQLIRWAHINSGSRNYAGLALMRTALADAFAVLPEVEVQHLPLPGSEALALSVRCRPQAPHQVMLSGHYDTVFDSSHPFQECTLLDEITLRGPGVVDMKGGIVVMLAALKAFESCPEKRTVGWEVLLTPDEEIGSEASAALIQETARRYHFGLVFEPARASGDLVRSRKGSGNFRISSFGRSAHAGQVPNPGRNAIAALAEFLVGAHAIPSEIPTVLLNIGHIQGGGPVNVVPEFACADLNIRTSLNSDGPAVLARLHALAAPINERDGHRLTVEGKFDCPPKECGPVEESIYQHWQQLAQELGLAPFSWVHTGGASDGNLLSAAGLPNLDGVGPVGGNLHTADEYCHLPSLVERAQLATGFLHRLAAGKLALPARG